MNTYTIFRAMEIANAKNHIYTEMKWCDLNKHNKVARQMIKFRDEMVRRCERYDLAKMQIKDLKEQRDQLVRERIEE